MLKKALSFIVDKVRQVTAFFLRRPVIYLANRYSSAPQKEKVFESLSELYEECTKEGSKSLFMANYDRPIIVFSDHHKGNKGGSDEFALAEDTYVEALNYYNERKAYYINLGDSEDFWKYNIFSIMKHNKKSFAAERQFQDRRAFVKVYGNHDMMWHMDPLAPVYLKEIFGSSLRVFEGLVVRFPRKDGDHIDFFCTHGHQGDARSDGNAFSVWFVTYIWAPLQSFLRVNINTPAKNKALKSVHNQLMYEWSIKQRNVVLITGHTHQPVFNSMSHLERLYLNLGKAKQEQDEEQIERIRNEIPRRATEYDVLQMGFDHLKPSYFNAGCCCFDDGTITGIEFDDGYIRLVVWSKNKETGKAERVVAEEERLTDLLDKIYEP